MNCNRVSRIGHRAGLIWLSAVVAMHWPFTVQADEQPGWGELWARIEKHSQPPAEFEGKLGSYRSPLKFGDGSTVRTADEWTRRRKEILETWRKRLGGWPALVERPNVKRIETIEKEGHAQHHVHVQISPDGKLADGYLLVPPGTGPFPAVFVPFYELLGRKQRVAMTARATHVPTAEALALELDWLEYWLKGEGK